MARSRPRAGGAARLLGIWLAAALALLPASSAFGDTLREERDVLQSRLRAEQAALSLLENREVDVLGVIELVERVQRRAHARLEALREERAVALEEMARAERRAEQARAAFELHLQLLRPKLRALHRLSQQSGLETLLSADDFGALVWTSRALGKLLEEDLRYLEEVARVRAYLDASERRRRALAEILERRSERLAQWARAAAVRERALAELLDLVRARASQKGRVLAELRRADRSLTQRLADLEGGPAESGFGALKGSLPLPTKGFIEVGYGKVVDPRFNTETDHLGLDIRAPGGTSVRALAPGTVVFADWMRGYGNLLIIDHGDGYHALMAHLEAMAPSVGQSVRAGEVVAWVGDSASLKGPYLYFELRHDGRPLDPAGWIDAGR